MPRSGDVAGGAGDDWQAGSWHRACGAPGRRLSPLTAERAKGAVPFGGQYRLVDFTLSNLTTTGELAELFRTARRTPAGG